MERRHSLMDSPLGPLTLVATDGALSGVYMTDHRHMPPRETFGARSAEPFPQAVAQLDAYFRGELREFDLPLHLEGTGFQRLVWKQLTLIPYGETRSYGQLAAALGRPGASRAVGLANGKNPVSIVVPCHRVVGSTGGLTGYGGGLANKQRLLTLESGHVEAPPGALF
ncbi:methylated-DNA--[protein]-cysteine S-methyltransferase [Streptomyces fuscigenes]|uniref:methylated-DNA--[protein]-cysteine S-methyltransferase n=1 Tax=Streptomyces fuscigenes TaxID=1528880 RepID=UPI001F43CD12|nr:methylated-DNA--[protein]-cysteine S-methyltransferase [Streptomyces fuscigenes]MCF3963703.1 methylated-DNA--[protein]-cysteine S-methyltransferase [Streptomyces fuscigenes]